MRSFLQECGCSDHNRPHLKSFYLVEVRASHNCIDFPSLSNLDTLALSESHAIKTEMYITGSRDLINTQMVSQLSQHSMKGIYNQQAQSR